MTSYLIHHLEHPWVIYEDETKRWFAQDDTSKIHGAWGTPGQAEAWVRNVFVSGILGSWGPDQSHLQSDIVVQPYQSVLFGERPHSTATSKRTLRKRVNDDRIGRTPAR